MAEKDLSLTVLFDIYGGLLSDSEKEDFEYYYCDDLSLSEIAENTGRTRQGARDNIVRAEKALRLYEEKLGLKKKFEQTEASLSEAVKAIDCGMCDKAKDIINSIKF